MAKRPKTPYWKYKPYRYTANITKGPIFWADIELDIKERKRLGRGLPFYVRSLDTEVRAKYYEEMLDLAPGEGLRMAQLEDPKSRTPLDLIVKNAVFIPRGMKIKKEGE